MSALGKIALASAVGLTAPLIVGGVRHVRLSFPAFSIVILASRGSRPPARARSSGPFHIESELTWVAAVASDSQLI
jgi:hypothetical protein